MADVRPNVLLLLTDDQRFDTINAWGAEAVHTPNIDKLTARGVSFRNAYIMGGSSGAVCMPSRAMLHTGRHLYNLDGQGQTIPQEHVLLGEHLRAAGYQTWGTGKWHNSPAAFNRSFDGGAKIYFGGMNDHWNIPACDYHADGNYPEPREINMRWGQRIVRQRMTFDRFATGSHSTDLFTDAAIEQLDHFRDDAPFFMSVAFMAPHDPREMPPQFLDMYDPEQIELPPNFLPAHPFDNGSIRGRDEDLAPYPRTEADTRKQLAEYYAMITHLDHAVGRLFDALEARGQLENTIIVFVGDNGLAVGQHGLFGKQSNYEHSVHVPLVFAGPGIPKGEDRDAMCYLLDIYPTLCDLLGREAPASVQGRSLAPVIADAAAPPARDRLYFAYTHLMRSVRDERWKLIETCAKGKRYTQLFDLAADPWEMHNLAADERHFETLCRLRDDLQVWRTEYADDQSGQGEAFWADHDAFARVCP